jgi:hypothetical protein
MGKYIITKVERYEVEASDPTVALNHFHLWHNNIPAEDLGLTSIILMEDDFEYLDGTDSVEEA